MTTGSNRAIGIPTSYEHMKSHLYTMSFCPVTSYGLLVMSHNIALADYIVCKSWSMFFQIIKFDNICALSFFHHWIYFQYNQSMACIVLPKAWSTMYYVLLLLPKVDCMAFILCGNRVDNVGGFEWVTKVIWVCSLFLVIFIVSLFRISLIVLSLFLFIVCNVFAPFSHFKRFMLSLLPCKFIKHSGHLGFLF